MKKMLFALVLVTAVIFVGLVEFNGLFRGVFKKSPYQISSIPTRISLITSEIPKFEFSAPPVVPVSYQKPIPRPAKKVVKKEIIETNALTLSHISNDAVPLSVGADLLASNTITSAISPEYWLQIEQQVAENEFSVGNFTDEQFIQIDPSNDAIEFGTVNEEEFAVVESLPVEKIE